MPTIPTTALEPSLVELIARTQAALDSIVSANTDDEHGLSGNPDWEDRAAVARDLETIADTLRSTR